MFKEVQFNYDSFDIAEAIFNRAESMGIAPEDKMGVMMDLMAANGENGNVPLDYVKMLAFSDGSFGHDFNGIYANLNRRTGQLENCFLPRCARS